MNRNLGTTSLRRTRRPADAMQRYDALPEPLRQWLSQAALPWSPASAQRLWKRALAKGLNTKQALHVLSIAEANTLLRERHSPLSSLAPNS